jgi:uncharacterized membrane protein
MPTTDIRPLSFGELLDRTFTYYRKHFWTFAGIMAIPQILGFLQATLTAFLVLPLRALTAAKPHPGSFKHLSSSLTLVGVTAIFVLLYLILSSLAYGAVTSEVSEVQLGRSLTILECYRRPLKRAGSLVILTVLFLLLVLVGAITIVLPILMCLWYAFAVPVLMEETASPRKALKRSRQLSKGNRGNIFAMAFLMGLMAWIAAAVAGFPLTMVALILALKKLAIPIWLQILTALFQRSAAALTTSLVPIGLALLYYDLRVKKEGYDLQVMMENLGPEKSPGQAFQASV